MTGALLWLRAFVVLAAALLVAACTNLDLDRLAISPQCGFASTVAGNPVSEADERAKLSLVMKAAREIFADRDEDKRVFTSVSSLAICLTSTFSIVL